MLRPGSLGYQALRGARATALLLLVAGVSPRPGSAQGPSWGRTVAAWGLATVGVAGVSVLDGRIREASLEHRDGRLRTLADVGNTLGTGRTAIAGLAVAYVGARLTHHPRAARAVLRVAAGYAFPNAIVGVLKPIVGRHRPDSTNDAFRFRPFSAAGDWHSLPSSHAVHAFSLASGLGMVTSHRWISTTAFAGAGLVAWSRIYDDQHWASDVAASGLIGTAAARGVIRWLDRRGEPAAHARTDYR